MPPTDRFHLITGGPGAGKTTLIEALEKSGHACMPEAGRAIIRDQTAIDGPALPGRDPAAFAEAMLMWEMCSHGEAERLPGPVFFDRGVPDVAGYLRLIGLPAPPHVDRAARRIRYNRRAFMAPPWREIFAQDAERRQSFGEAERTHDALVAAYRTYNYELVELPRAPVGERLRFVLDRL